MPAPPNDEAVAGDGDVHRGSRPDLAPAHGVGHVVTEVLRARRYRWLAPALVRRTAVDEMSKARNEAEAIKRTKRRLHQVCGAYAMDLDPAAAVAHLGEAKRAGGAAWRQACLDLMRRHASTRERLLILDRFYRDVFAVTGSPTLLMDLACGLGPLALPWMDLPSDTTYIAYDVDRRLTDTVDGFLTLAGQPHRVELRDVAAEPPAERAGVALLLKSAPCLEQQAPGSARRILKRLNAEWIVISYPTRSLGGAGKGMPAHYRAQFQALAGGCEAVQELSYAQELVFVARMPSPADNAGAVKQPSARSAAQEAPL